MSRKNNWNKLMHSDKKEHYRMYKSGKSWVYAMITTYGGMLGLTAYSQSVKAEETSTSLETSKEVTDKEILATQDTATIPSDQNQTSETATSSVVTSTTETTQSTNETNNTLTSLSDSESISFSSSTSISEQLSQSTSVSISASTSMSLSKSTSDSLSVSNQASTSDSQSLSSSTSGSNLISQSTKDLKDSQSVSSSNSISVSKSTSQSTSIRAVNEESMTSQSDAQATSQAQDLFDQLGSEKVDVSVDSKTSELTIITQDYKAPSSALIRATQQYPAANNLVAYFALRDATGKTTKVKVSSDPDASRAEFEDILNNGGTAKTPTSVTVTVSDQITNKEIYKQTRIAS